MASLIPKKKNVLAQSVHAIRVGVVAALLLAIPSPVLPSISESGNAPTVQQVRDLVPMAELVESQPDAAGLWTIQDADGGSLGRVARTLPAANKVVGYRGPTEAMIVFDQDLAIDAVRLLQSTDTQEHVDAVVADEIFFEQFKTWKWGGPPASVPIDAVSGATLTSMALVEGVLKRIGGDRPSLIFPTDLSNEELADWFPNVHSIESGTAGAVIHDPTKQVIGRVIRSGTISDDVVGYQGPTELLMKVSPDDHVEAVRLRSSYDNEPYVDYVRQEFGFWVLFENKTIAELAQLDPEAAGIEGVSGATMTSLAVADTIVAAAKGTIANRAAAASAIPERASGVRWMATDVATLGFLLLAAVMSQAGLFRRRWPRRMWLCGAIAVVGFWSGNLISLALVAGWSAEGIAWRLAPGLTAMAAVALCLPPLTKGNPYCNHLCPHGAIQQLVRPGGKSKRRIRLPRRLSRWLSRLPGFSLVVAYLALIFVPSTDLSSWEPFHAYLFRIAGWGAIAFAAATLLIASVLPMGYCRLGCPTGRLIDHLRRTSTSHRIRPADGVAIVLLAIALSVRSLA